jgi:hypothetical protein
MKNILLQTFILLSFFLANLKTFSQESYVVKGDIANVREEPNLKAKILGTISGGKVVEVTNTDNPEWFFISYYGNAGYISSTLLEKIEESIEYKAWKKKITKTGESPDCENISPQYDNNLNNRLLIHVGNNANVAVKLMTLFGECIRIVYINAGDDYSILNIPEGYYYLKIAYGKDWRQKIENGQCIGQFMIDPSYERGTEKLDYYKIKKPNIIEGNKIYENWELPSYELFLNIEYTKGDFNSFNSNKITEKEFNR